VKIRAVAGIRALVAQIQAAVKIRLAVGTRALVAQLQVAVKNLELVVAALKAMEQNPEPAAGQRTIITLRPATE
jgi:hypothetical protein